MNHSQIHDSVKTLPQLGMEDNHGSIPWARDYRHYFHSFGMYVQYIQKVQRLIPHLQAFLEGRTRRRSKCVMGFDSSA